MFLAFGTKCCLVEEDLSKLNEVRGDRFRPFHSELNEIDAQYFNAYLLTESKKNCELCTDDKSGKFMSSETP